MTNTASGTYHVVENWVETPDFMADMPDVADVAVGPGNGVYIVTRRPSRILAYAPDGTFLRSWGQDILSVRPHGITVGPDGTVYCVDEGSHAVARFRPDGEFLGWIGIPGLPADTGLDASLGLAAQAASIQRAGPPFNRPTQLAVGPDGDLYVSDGYGNASLHHFDPTGRWLNTWGGPGSQAGEFRCPHHVVVSADERVFVSDRENGRVQIFDPAGRLLDVWELQRPAAIAISTAGMVFVAEMGLRPGEKLWSRGPAKEAEPPRITVLDSRGQHVERWVGDGDPCAPGNFVLPHGIAVDDSGSVYVAELRWSYRTARQVAAGQRRLDDPSLTEVDRLNVSRWGDIDSSPVPTSSPSLQKFALAE
jgi:DNA-binding beta-propeller fold protein YncE